MKKVNLEKIKRLRKIHKLSQGDMAELIGLNSLYPYHRKESGHQSFTAEEINTIAEFFKEPLENFFKLVIAKKASDKEKAI